MIKTLPSLGSKVALPKKPRFTGQVKINQRPHDFDYKSLGLPESLSNHTVGYCSSQGLHERLMSNRRSPGPMQNKTDDILPLYQAIEAIRDEVAKDEDDAMIIDFYGEYGGYGAKACVRAIYPPTEYIEFPGQKQSSEMMGFVTYGTLPPGQSYTIDENDNLTLHHDTVEKFKARVLKQYHKMKAGLDQFRSEQQEDA